jgi:protein-disulfide isomerase
MFCRFSVLILLFGSVFSIGTLPLPPKPFGFSRGESSAPIHIELFLDMVCPDSRTALFELEKVYPYYDSNVRLTIHLFPLPYHRNAFMSTQAAYVVNHHCPQSFYEFIKVSYRNLEDLTDISTMDLNANQVAKLIVGNAKLSKCKHENFETDLQPVSLFSSEARSAWKFGASRGVFGTPFVFVNGVSDTNRSYSAEEWKNLIESLLDRSLLKFQ